MDLGGSGKQTIMQHILQFSLGQVCSLGQVVADILTEVLVGYDLTFP